MIKQKQSTLVGVLLLIVGVLVSGATTAYGAKVSAILTSSSSRSGSALTSIQQVTITGKVTDAGTGEALPGVNVLVKGTTVGTATDAKGQYSLNISSANDTLVFSYIGYTTQSIPVRGRSVINVKLEQQAISGQQLVVVGYGTQTKESITGSVVSISGAKVNQVPSSNISSALQGRLPGVQISQTSSQPGATMQIRIRGTRSLNANNDPLIVLDGVPFGGSLSDINPEQIKSINILKDASATAIYGSRGANGVILIQTYKGKEGQKPQISYNSYVGIKKIFSYYPMMNGSQFVALRKAAGQYSNGIDESNNVNTNWQKLFFRPSAAISSQNLNVTGGTDHGSYNFGLGYYTNQSLVPTQQFKRYTLNGSLDQKVGDYVQFGLSTNTNYNTSDGSQINIYNVLSMSPIASPYNADGSLRRTIQMPLDNNWNETRGIVDSLRNQWLNPVNTFGTDNTLYGIVTIPRVKGLNYRINVGLNYRTEDNNSFTGEGINSSNPTTPSTAAIGHSVTLNWNIQNILTYNRTFGKSNVNITGLYEATKDSYHSSYVSRKGIPNSAFQFYQLGAGTGTITI
ncbi:MAG TPA: SusC/RagA family TonB-linked outer membrane protein, partial [Balneolales bacterium]|nr:SusC/RagA family TonB-linked outer membrane protein [Balneolales bacterium]